MGETNYRREICARLPSHKEGKYVKKIQVLRKAASPLCRRERKHPWVRSKGSSVDLCGRADFPWIITREIEHTSNASQNRQLFLSQEKWQS